MKRYAAFFEAESKCLKELSVSETLVGVLNGAGALGLNSPKLYSPDPPDCVCIDARGEPVAIEVTELVCQVATRYSALGYDVVRTWQPGELIAHVARVLEEKDHKHFNGGPYKQVVACLFTDEPALSFDWAVAELNGVEFGPFEQLTSGFLLFSYNPATVSYPCIELRLRAAKSAGP